jgi:hypothetical protein
LLPRGQKTKSARPGRRVRVEKWVAFPAWEITRIPKYYDERTRTKARYPKITRGRSGRRTRPVPDQKY